MKADKIRRTSLLSLQAVVLCAMALLPGGQASAARRQSSSSNASAGTSSGTSSGAASSNTGPKQDSLKDMPGMPGMNMDHGDSGGAGAKPDANVENDQHNQSEAMHSMQMGEGHHMHMTGPHMRMTAPRKATAEDWARADQVAATLKTSIEKYKDYRLALADGYRIFAPNVPQPEYHFTNYENGFLESFTFNPARPTSLLYKKTKGGGWELIGAMYTAARSASLVQLNERVPLGVAEWHAHTNLCMPAKDERAHADWTRFGLSGSIATEKACTAAGGRFYPQIFGWMVHVYPFETTREKIWGQ